MDYYHYVEDERMHTLISDSFTVMKTLIDHWDNTTNIPYRWVRQCGPIIEMDQLEELQGVRNKLKTQSGECNTPNPRFSL
jgi:hypothetical protein